MQFWFSFYLYIYFSQQFLLNPQLYYTYERIIDFYNNYSKVI